MSPLISLELLFFASLAWSCSLLFARACSLWFSICAEAEAVALCTFSKSRDICEALFLLVIPSVFCALMRRRSEILASFFCFPFFDPEGVSDVVGAGVVVGTTAVFFFWTLLRCPAECCEEVYVLFATFPPVQRRQIHHNKTTINTHKSQTQRQGGKIRQTYQ